MRHVSRTHRVALDRFVRQDKFRIQDPNQICWHQKPTRRHSNQRKLLTRWMESFSDFSDDQVRKQSAMSNTGQKTTSNGGSPMAKARPCLVARDPRSEDISSQSSGPLVRWKRRSRNSIQETGAIRLKIRSRIFSSESTREFSTSSWKQHAGGSTPNTQWWEKTFSLKLHKETCCVNTRETWNTRTINTWARPLSFCRRDWERHQATQHSSCKHTNQMYW